MKVTFLGTGTSQGVPMIACECEVCQSSDSRDKRLRSSILIEVDDMTIVVDTGPDFRYQMLRANVKKLHAVVFTHEHKDHIAGLDDVRGFNYIMRQSMDIFATERVQNALKREFYYAFETEKYPGVPELHLHSIVNEPFKVGHIPVIPIQLMHYKMPVFGYRIHDFAYITDANSIPEEEIEKLKGVKVMVINALRKTPHISHFSLEEALEVIRKVNPERAFLTHFSHQMGKYTDLIQELPSGVEPAFDGLEFEMD
jgi:phosphoribosyl 1,2-cyclic phosphate phosphodiesterase